MLGETNTFVLKFLDDTYVGTVVDPTLRMVQNTSGAHGSWSR